MRAHLPDTLERIPGVHPVDLAHQRRVLRALARRTVIQRRTAHPGERALPNQAQSVHRAHRRHPFRAAHLPKPRRKKVPFHLSRAYLRVQVADRLLMVLSALATNLEHPGQPLHRLALPCAHLVRVHLVTGRNPLNRVLFAQRLKRHLLFEFRRNSAPLLSHFCVSFFLWSTPWQPVQKRGTPSQAWTHSSSQGYDSLDVGSESLVEQD